MKILITAGATREPLDAVRFLSNVSTGTTGAALADEFARLNHALFFLRAEGAVQPRGRHDGETFSSARDLQERMQRHLATGTFDAVVMAAAVADYRPADVAPGKIPSDAVELTLRLVRTEKILPRIKAMSTRPLRVVGFKLTVGAHEAARRMAVSMQFAAGGVDAVVHNDLAEIRAGGAHPFWLWRSASGVPIRVSGAEALAESLLEWLEHPAS